MNMKNALVKAEARLVDLENDLDALERVVANSSEFAKHSDELVAHIQDFRSLSTTMRLISKRATDVLHTIEARVSNMRDHERDALRARSL